MTLRLSLFLLLNLVAFSSLSFAAEGNLQDVIDQECITGNAEFCEDASDQARKERASIDSQFNQQLKKSEERKLYLPKSHYDTLISKNIISQKIRSTDTENSFREIFTKEQGIIRIVNIVIGAVAISWLLILGAKFTFALGESDKIEKYKKEFGYIALGLIIVALASVAGFQLFDPASKTGALGDFLEGDTAKSNFGLVANNIKLYFEIIVGGIAMIVMLMSAYDLIINGDKDETLENEKRFFQAFLFAVFSILTAEFFAFFFADPTGSGGTSRGVNELTGLINFLLTFVGVAAGIMLIVASLYYVISFGDEDRTGRAKRIIIGSIVGIIIAFSSYTIVRFFVG